LFAQKKSKSSFIIVDSVNKTALYGKITKGPKGRIDTSEVLIPGYDINNPPKIVDHVPTFQGEGGNNESTSAYFKKHMKYPQDAIDKNINGTTTIQFTIDEHGKVINPKITRRLYPSLDKEAIRLVQSMPQWIPAVHNEKHVKMTMEVDIDFSTKTVN